MTFKNENKNNNEGQNPGTANTNNTRSTTTKIITKFTVHKYHILNNYTIVTLNPEYSNLINPLKDLEYNSLRISVKEKGLYLPIIINQDNVLLDGHHRFQICKELGIEPRFEVKKFEDPLDERQFIIDINDKRRHLNDFQKAELAYELEKIESERAKLRSLNNLKHVKDKLSKRPIDHFEHTTYKGKTRDIVSRKVGISQGSYERAKTIIKYGSEQSKEKLRDGRSTIFKEVEKIRKDQKRQELISRMKISESESNCKKTLDNCRLMLGDFRDKGKEIEDNSIDLISTDPPYGEQYLYLYEDLAEFSARVLKPGGSIVFFVGHIILDQVIGIFNNFSLIIITQILSTGGF
ncbi:MAG TPA: ParB N-terminal domain-containing protein [Nitrososphaeraceae archaeon]|nr:ParB N-terminal domain-containing protein [Nitrososphaeraceae archaeon]